MDVLEAEAVADLVAAETAPQRRQPLRRSDGQLGAGLQGWSGQLQNMFPEQEALIDFPDEVLPAET